MTKVSIIIPIYNQAQYLSETLDSVLAQSHSDWECVIADDGSSDGTKEVAMEYCKKDKRFKYIYQENQGPSVARNNGIQNSHGEFILPLDSDDLIAKDYLREALEVFEKNPKTKLVYCYAELFGVKTGFWNIPKYDYEKLLFGNMIFCTAMYQRADYDKTSGYNPNMRKGLEDWDFWLSLIGRDDIVYRIPKVHFYYRIRNKSRNDGLNNEGAEVEKLYKQIYDNHSGLYAHMANPIYSDYQLRRKSQMIIDRDEEICKYKKELHKIIREREREMQIVTSSKFWKLRNLCLQLKFALLSPIKFWKKYFKKPAYLADSFFRSIKNEGFGVTAIRFWNFVVHGKGTLDPRAIAAKEEYADLSTVLANFKKK
ncbi:MAG: glycosyltransferase family A protein [Parcubacteria group bacterium]|jgi:glycosyltransferase involved in cell wall biosynthesis